MCCFRLSLRLNNLSHSSHLNSLSPWTIYKMGSVSTEYKLTPSLTAFELFDVSERDDLHNTALKAEMSFSSHWSPRTMWSDVPVEVAAVLEDLVAEGAAVHPLVLSGFVSLHDSPAVWSAQQAAALCCCWGHRLGTLHGGLHICTHQESNVKQKSAIYAAMSDNKAPTDTGFTLAHIAYVNNMLPCSQYRNISQYIES